MNKCQECQKDLSLAKLTNYETEKDLLICVQCYWKEAKKYSDYSASHFPLLKRNGKIYGISEALVVWDYQKK